MHELGYSRQMNKKVNQVGNEYPKRDEQFEYLKYVLDYFKREFPL